MSNVYFYIVTAVYAVTITTCPTLVSAFSSSIIHNYAVPQPSTFDRKNTHLNARNLLSITQTQAPGSELFPTPGSSYVPSGLTKEQYAEIKQVERNDLKTKDFASWGPKFAKSTRPDGDWMTLPSLWTGGFNGNQDKTGNRKNTNGSDTRVQAADSQEQEQDSAMVGVKKRVGLYALTFLMMECLLSCTLSLSKRRSISLLASIMSASARTTLASMIRVNSIKLFVFVPLFMRPVERLIIEPLNRRLDWSLKRSMRLTGLTSVGFGLVWNLLMFVKK